MGKHKQNTNEYKLQAIEDYKNSQNISKTAETFNIDRKTLREWIAAEENIREAPKTRCRGDGGGRKLTSESFEDTLVNQIEDFRLRRMNVSRSLIMKWAHELKENAVENLSLSVGWLTGFLRRNKFSLRKVSNASTLSDEEIVRRASSFISHVKKIIFEYRITPENIWNMDETAIFIEDDETSMIERVGSKRVAISSSGLTKFRVTGICAASAVGTKKHAAVIVKGRNEDIIQCNGFIKIVGEKAWMNSKLFKKWIDFVFPAVITPPNATLLVLDSARCHISAEVKQHLQIRKILYCVIPGGLTGWIQPADLSWFKPVKTMLREYAFRWLQCGSVPRTKSGEIKPPTFEQVGVWLQNSWGRLHSEIIINSFNSGFLGDIGDLHIAKDATIGPKFLDYFNHSLLPETADIIFTPDHVDEESVYNFSDIEDE